MIWCGAIDLDGGYHYAKEADNVEIMELMITYGATRPYVNMERF